MERPLYAHVPREDLKRELLASAVTAILFGTLFGVVFGGLNPTPLTHRGLEGALEFFAWLGLVVLLHDTYFYWSHRLLHHRLLFSRVHALHHRSTNPSPFTRSSRGERGTSTSVNSRSAHC